MEPETWDCHSHVERSARIPMRDPRGGTFHRDPLSRADARKSRLAVGCLVGSARLTTDLRRDLSRPDRPRYSTRKRSGEREKRGEENEERSEIVRARITITYLLRCDLSHARASRRDARRITKSRCTTSGRRLGDGSGRGGTSGRCNGLAGRGGEEEEGVARR